MNFLSLFTGIGGFDLAFSRAGMESVGMCEIDKNCRALLAARFPNAPLFEDVRNVGTKTHAAKSIDVLCGGFPCQDLSVAGKRAGLAGERSGLWFEFARVIDELEPGTVVIENVPGLLSSNRGRDFAVIVGWLAKRGYGVAWRVLDAEYFGVAQRRRRVFIVGSLGDGRAAEILFEREGVFGDTPPRREAGEGTAADVAPSLAASGRGVERAGESRGQDPVIAAPLNSAPPSRRNGGSNPTAGTMVAYVPNNYGAVGGGYRQSDVLNTLDSERGTKQTQLVARSLTARNQRNDAETENLLAFMPRASASRSMPTGDVVSTLEAAHNAAPAIAFTERTRKDGRNFEAQEDLAYALTNPGGGGRSHSRQVAGGFGVRRLTPTECERLQGFPDGWTDGFSDSVRYRMLGNAVAVPVVEWIGRRIVEVADGKAIVAGNAGGS